MFSYQSVPLAHYNHNSVWNSPLSYLCYISVNRVCCCVITIRALRCILQRDFVVDDGENGIGGGDNDKDDDDDGDNDDICVMMVISCWNNAGKVILVTNTKFSSTAVLPVCQSSLYLRKSTVEITLKSPKGYMPRTSREETQPHTNKSIKTAELSQHNCDIRVHSRPSHEADRCGSWSRPLHVACEWDTGAIHFSLGLKVIGCWRKVFRTIAKA